MNTPHMRVAILLAEGHPTGWEQADEAVRARYFEQHAAFDLACRERGRLVIGEALADVDAARTARHDGTGWRVTDGPYAEAAEHLGGLYLVDVPSLDVALELAALLPESYSVEVRPCVDIEGWEPPA